MSKQRTRKPEKTLKQSTLLQSFSSPSRPDPPKRTKKKTNPAAASTTTSPPRKRKRRSPQPQGEESDSDVGAIKFVDADDSDEGPSPTKRRKLIVIPSGDEGGSDDSGPVYRRLKKREESGKSKGKGKGRAAPQDNLDSEEDVAPRKTKSRLHKGSRKPVIQEDSESDDLSEDRIIEARFRSRDKKTAFQKNLEKLKRKKQGKPMESTDEEEEEEYSQASAPEEDQLLKGARKTAEVDEDKDSLFDEKEDEEEDDKSADFIVDDDGDGGALLPVEFRAQQDLAHHFKTIFQFFVHVAVREHGERHDFMEKQMKDEYFSVPLQVARRKIVGLRDSLVASSVWRPEFRKSVEALPKFDLYQLDFSIPACDACHLGGRVSTLRGQLGGAPYHMLGFEEIVSDPDDSDSDEPRKSRKKKKKKQKKESKKESGFLDTLHLGRFCARRTRVFHDLSHWEYHLFKAIESEVDELHTAKNSDGYVRVAWANGRKPPEDLGDADGICEWLDERQFIEREWQRLKSMMDSATKLEVSAKKGEDLD